jgi:hypothetical protein
MLGAAAQGLHRREHVTAARHQIPASSDKIGSINLPSFVNPSRSTSTAIRDDGGPHHITIAPDDGVCASLVVCFLRIQGGVNSAENHIRTPVARDPPDLIPAQRIRRVNTDPNDIARFYLSRIERNERFVNQEWGSEAFRRRTGEHKKPTGRNYGGPERHLTRIKEMNPHHACKA